MNELQDMSISSRIPCILMSLYYIFLLFLQIPACSLCPCPHTNMPQTSWLLCYCIPSVLHRTHTHGLKMWWSISGSSITLNSLALRDLKCIFKPILPIVIVGTSCAIGLRWLVNIGSGNGFCHQATSHNMSQYWADLNHHMVSLGHNVLKQLFTV